MLRINFKRKRVRIIKPKKKVRHIRRVRINLSNPVVVLSEMLYRMEKLEKENRRLRKENKEIKERMATHRDIYKVASEYTESLEEKVDELENEISNLKEAYNGIEYILNNMKTNNRKKRTKKESKPVLIDSSHESDESILFELSQTWKDYLYLNKDEMVDINWAKLEQRVGRPIKGIREEEIKWGFPILNRGQSITDDMLKGFRSEVREATINARRG